MEAICVDTSCKEEHKTSKLDNKVSSISCFPHKYISSHKYTNTILPQSSGVSERRRHEARSSHLAVSLFPS